MKNVVIVSAKRTPVGRKDGQFKQITEAKLTALTLEELAKADGSAIQDVEEIIIGNSKQTSLPSNLARYAMLEANYPEEIPAYTVQKHTASGMQALVMAFMGIKSGIYTQIIAGGVESTSQVPVEIQKARYEFNEFTDIIFDPITRQERDAQPQEKYGTIDADTLIEKIERQYNLTNEVISESLKMINDQQAVLLGDHIVPVHVKVKKEILEVRQDESGLVNEKAVHGDAAGSLLMMEKETAIKNNQPILAEIIGVHAAAGNPETHAVDIRPILRLLEQEELKVEDLSILNICETSASYVTAMKKQLEQQCGVKLTMINPIKGGLTTAIPGAATGIVQVIDSIDFLNATKGRYGIVVIPNEGGETIAVLLETSSDSEKR